MEEELLKYGALNAIMTLVAFFVVFLNAKLR